MVLPVALAMAAISAWIYNHPEKDDSHFSHRVATSPDGSHKIVYLEGDLAIYIMFGTTVTLVGPGENFADYSLVRARHHGEPDHLFETGESIYNDLVEHVLTLGYTAHGRWVGTYRVRSDPVLNTEVLGWFVFDSASNAKIFENQALFNDYLLESHDNPTEVLMPIAAFLKKHLRN